MNVKEPILHTFSIVAYDPKSNSWGAAVASKFLAVGAIVIYASSDAGAVATQSAANMSFGPKGLELLRKGRSAKETMDELLLNDDNPQERQVGIVDKKGNSATYTGKNCTSWA